jgi:hypothetical protein
MIVYPFSSTTMLTLCDLDWELNYEATKDDPSNPQARQTLVMDAIKNLDPSPDCVERFVAGAQALG